MRVSPGNISLAVSVASDSLQIGRLDEAESHAKLALKATPTEAHRILAEIAIGRKDWAGARREAAAAGGEKRDRPLSQMLLGRVALGDGKVEEALKDFDSANNTLQAGHRQPLPKLSYYRGDALARQGRGDEAQGALFTAIKLYPADPQPYKKPILLYPTPGQTPEAASLTLSSRNAAP